MKSLPQDLVEAGFGGLPERVKKIAFSEKPMPSELV